MSRASDAPPTPSTDRGEPERGWLRRTLSDLRWSVHNDLHDAFVRPVREEDREPREVEGYELRFGAPADLDAATEYHTELTPTCVEHGRRRLEIDHRLVVATHDGLPVFTMWVNPRHLNVPGELKRKLSPDEVFIYKAFTSPDHRGKRLYQAGMALVLRDLAERSMRRLVGYAHVKKGASRAGLARLGFESAGTWRTVGFKGLRHPICSREFEANFPERVPRSGAGLE